VEYLFPKARADYLVGTQTCVIECRPVGVEWRAAWVQNNNRLRNCVGNPAKFAFIVPQFLFGLLKRFDVGACSIPTDDLAGFIA
jgi:hypothetical protein